MIEQLLRFIKDPAKVTRLTIIGFFGAVLVTTYFLFTLSNDLVYQGGMIDSGRATAVYAKLFTAIGVAFAFCYFAIRYVHLSKKETIVYLDKKTEARSAQAGGNASQGQGKVNLSLLQETIGKAKTHEEKWQQGLNLLCHQLNAGQGALYLTTTGEKKYLELKAGFALVLADNENTPSFEAGEGLIGQVAESGKCVYLDELPEGYAARIESGLGNALPKFLFIIPLKKENEIRGVVEVALFTALTDADQKQALDAGTILAEI